MEIAVLIARIILIILEGVAASTAVNFVAGTSGVGFTRLWKALPKKYK